MDKGTAENNDKGDDDEKKSAPAATKPGAVSVSPSDDENQQNNGKGGESSKGLRQADPYHQSSETVSSLSEKESTSGLRQAASYQESSEQMASSYKSGKPDGDTKKKSASASSKPGAVSVSPSDGEGKQKSDKGGESSKGLRQAAPYQESEQTTSSSSSATALPAAVATVGKPSSKKGANDEPSMSLAPGVEEDSQIGAISVDSSRSSRASRGKKNAAAALSKKGGTDDSSSIAPSVASSVDDDSRVGAVSVASSRASRGKGRGRRKFDEQTVDSQTTASMTAASRTSREIRDNEKDDEALSDDEDDDDMEEGADGVQLGAIPVAGIDAFGTPREEEETHNFIEQPALEAAPENPDGLVEAIPVDEDVEKDELGTLAEREDLARAEEVDEAEVEKGMKGFLLQHLRVVGLISVMLVIGIVLGIVFGIRNSGGSTTSIDQFQEVYRTGSIRFRDAADILLGREVSDISLLLSPSLSTPQYRALTWLADEDAAEIDFSDEGKLVQRYVLAVVQFSTGGDGWLDGLNFTSSSNECEWNSVRFGSSYGVVNCTEDGFVTELLLGMNLEGTLFIWLFDWSLYPVTDAFLS
jgi:hypothetical protein